MSKTLWMSPDEGIITFVETNTYALTPNDPVGMSEVATFWSERT